MSKAKGTSELATSTARPCPTSDSTVAVRMTANAASHVTFSTQVIAGSSVRDRPFLEEVRGTT